MCVGDVTTVVSCAWPTAENTHVEAVLAMVCDVVRIVSHFLRSDHRVVSARPTYRTEARDL